MDRAEPRATFAAAFHVGQHVGYAVQIFILPAIVVRHALNISAIDHGVLSRRERGLGLADDGLESRRLGDRQIREHFAVDRNAGLGEARDEAAVIETEWPHRGVEALDPQRTECALSPLAIAEGILVRLLHRLLGDADGVLAPAVIALGGFKHFFVLGMGCDAALDACHGFSPSKSETLSNQYRRSSAVRQKVLFDLVAVGFEHHVGPAQLADLLFGALDHAVALARLLIEDLAPTR